MKLYEVGTIITGNTPSKNNDEYYISDDIMFIKPGDIEEKYITNLKKSEDYISEKARNKVRILPKGTVLVTCIGTIGKVGILENEATCNQQINAIIPNNMILSKYLAYLIKSKQKILQLKANAPVVPIINKTDFSKIEINICDREEQKKIVKKLDLTKKIIDIRKKQIEELRNFIKSQFVEMFGNIHLNDKKWEKFVKMNEICEINPKKSEISDLRNIMVSFVPMQSVTEDGKIYTDDKRNINDVKSGFTYFRENDVLFAKITPCMENGKGAIAVNLENKIGFGSTEFHVIRPGKYVNPLWIYTLAATKEFRQQAEMSMTGSAGQKRVSSKYLENYRIGVPPITLQNQFSEIVKQIDKQKFESMIQLKMMEKIYNIINDRRRYV